MNLLGKEEEEKQQKCKVTPLGGMNRMQRKVNEMAEKWIQKAIKKPGALHKELGVPQGKKIPEKKLEKATYAKGKLGQRARLAETLKKMH
jgi:hypothetical protein